MEGILLQGAQVQSEPSPVRYLPTWDRVLVRELRSGMTTRLGLLLPENFQGKLKEGEVLATGPGRVTDSGVRVPSEFNIGDVVLFSDQAALRFDPDAPDQFMIAAPSLLAIRK